MSLVIHQILSQAKIVAARQRKLASSPGQRDNDGTVVMCAAACIGYAAIQFSEGNAAANAFRQRIIDPSRANAIEETFAEKGLDIALCSRIRIENDETFPERRLRWFLNLTIA